LEPTDGEAAPADAASTACASTAGTICSSAASSAGVIAGRITAGTSEYRIRSLIASCATTLGDDARSGEPAVPTCAGLAIDVDEECSRVALDVLGRSNR
jgi:hypothetical protein